VSGTAQLTVLLWNAGNASAVKAKRHAEDHESWHATNLAWARAQSVEQLSRKSTLQLRLTNSLKK
jgi:hypothetical protein